MPMEIYADVPIKKHPRFIRDFPAVELMTPEGSQIPTQDQPEVG